MGAAEGDPPSSSAKATPSRLLHRGVSRAFVVFTEEEEEESERKNSPPTGMEDEEEQ